MANTKNVSDRAERKKLKREQRKGLKQAFQAMSPKEKKKWQKSEVKGLRAYLAAKPE